MSMNLALLTAALFAASYGAFAATLTSGDGGAYADIQEALDAANAGDEVVILAGTYVRESTLTLTGKKNLVVSGQGAVNLFCSDMYSTVFYAYDLENVTLRNLHLRHTNPPAEMGCTGGVVYLNSCRKVSITGCEIDGCGLVGVWATECADLVVSNTRLHDNSHAAFMLWSVDGMTVKGCTIESNGVVMTQEEVKRLSMTNNTVRNNMDYASPLEIINDRAKAVGKRARFLLEYTGKENNEFMFYDGGDIRYWFAFDAKVLAADRMPVEGSRYLVTFTIRDADMVPGTGMTLRGVITATVKRRDDAD